MKFTNKTYDYAKYICLVGLPAVSTFVAAFGAIWGMPYTSEIVKTIVAINLLASSLIVVKGMQFNNSDARFDGYVDVTRTGEGQDDVITNIDMKHTVERVTGNGEVLLKVREVA